MRPSCTVIKNEKKGAFWWMHNRTRKGTPASDVVTANRVLGPAPARNIWGHAANPPGPGPPRPTPKHKRAVQSLGPGPATGDTPMRHPRSAPPTAALMSASPASITISVEEGFARCFMHNAPMGQAPALNTVGRGGSDQGSV